MKQVLHDLIDALPDEYQHTAYNILHALKSIIPVAATAKPATGGDGDNDEDDGKGGSGDAPGGGV